MQLARFRPDCYTSLLQSWTYTQDPTRKRFFALGILAAATTQNDGSALREWLPRFQGVLDQEALEEAVLQTHLFAGYPRTIEAMKVVRQYYPLPVRKKAVVNRLEAGVITSRTIYGKHHPKLIRVMDELHPDLRQWMIEDGYGRVLSRPGLSLQEREIAVLAALMAAGMPDQFRAHLRGAFFTGIERADIIWFTRIFRCIIPAKLKDDFERVNQHVFNSMN